MKVDILINILIVIFVTLIVIEQFMMFNSLISEKSLLYTYSIVMFLLKVSRDDLSTNH